MVWSCLLFIRSGQNHLARHSERGKKTRRTKEEVGRQHQGMDWPGVRQVPEGSGEQGKMEKTGCRIICGAPTTLAVKGLMMMMMTFRRWLSTWITDVEEEFGTGCHARLNEDRGSRGRASHWMLCPFQQRSLKLRTNLTMDATYNRDHGS